MPCFNLGEHTQEALDSLFAQTFQDFALIIADDASTDKSTKTTLKNLKLPRGNVYFESKNLGVSKLRNKYMKQLDTKYVMSFDPDDVLEPTFLEKSVNYLELHPKKAAVAVWLELFGNEQGIAKLDEAKTGLPDMLITNNYLGSCVMRKTAFDQIGGYDTSTEITGAEDYDFWLSVLEHGWQLGVLPEVLFRYRRSKHSQSSRSAMPEKTAVWRKKLIQNHLQTYQKYLIDVLLGFEARASGAHAGYLETNASYIHLHDYVETELIPKLHKQETIINKLRRGRSN
jgi:GT2 family glycosyltransferase